MPEKRGPDPDKPESPFFGLSLPAAIPEGALTLPEMKTMLPPNCRAWRYLTAPGGWGAQLEGYGAVTRSWSIGGHRAAAEYVLRVVWTLFLFDNGMANKDCPVKGLLFDDSEV